MKTKHIIPLAAFLAAVSLHAQDAGVPQEAVAQPAAGQAAPQIDDTASFLDSTPEALGTVVNQALESAQKWVAKKGWKMGAGNPDGRYVAVGSAPVAVPPSDQRFAQMRVNAFSKAMLDAKASLAKNLTIEIKTDVTHLYGQGSAIRKEREEAEAAANRKNAGMFAKIKMLITAKLDALLESEGILPDSKKAEDLARKELNSDTFNQLIESSAKAAVSGVVCAKVFEENGRIAVVATYTDNTRVLADAFMGTGATPSVPPSGNLQEWINALTPAQLYASFGIQLRADEKGNLVVLSYGQAVSQTDSSLSQRNATTRAETMADAYIRQFAGETASYAIVVENLEQTKEFPGKIFDATVEDFQDTALRSTAGKLKISGIQTARIWQTKDTRSGKIIIGVVRIWSLESSNEAQRVGAELAMPPGQRVPTNRPQAKAAAPATPQKDPNKPYKIESAEGDDF